MDNKKTYHISTFGCQMNARDSEKIAGALLEMGYIPAPALEEADVAVFNTCCVRGHAESRVYGRLGYLKHLKQKRRGMKIVLCGCMAQRDETAGIIERAHPYVDVVVGTLNLGKLTELLKLSIETGGQIIDTRTDGGGLDGLYPEARRHRNRSGLNITYGCDNFCSYCVVPYVRGRERSREPGEITDEARRLIESGVKEITLLGQNVNSYGRGLAENIDFAGLLRLVADTGAESVKFLTSHPKDLSDKLIETVAGLESVRKFIHLPVQSGSTDVLRRMNRGYSKAGYLELVSKIRKAIPGVSVTTDIIVGFPGETENDFEDTLDVCREARFNGAFTFIYSKRPGTPAADMPGQLEHEVLTERFKRLTDAVNPIVHEYNRAKEGQTIRVLPENATPDGATGMYKGRTDDNTPVHYSLPDGAEPGWGFIDVTVTEGKPFYLIGKAGK